MKNEKTKAVVWDAIRTALKPEKKIWTAGIEIYRLVISNSPPGNRKMQKGSPCFRILDHQVVAMMLAVRFVMFLCHRGLRKFDFRVPKFILWTNFYKNEPLAIFMF